MWYVVYITCEGKESTAVIPKTWFNDGVTSWPKSRSHVTSWCKSSRDPKQEPDKWTTYPTRILHAYGKF